MHIQGTKSLQYVVINGNTGAGTSVTSSKIGINVFQVILSVSSYPHLFVQSKL